MPPAFNLSQDQTLQFNLCFPDIAAEGRSLKILTNLLAKITFISCERLMLYILSCLNRSSGHITSNAHTYRLLIVKEFLLFSGAAFVDKALCLSAAER
jgi:hypothetical protein